MLVCCVSYNHLECKLHVRTIYVCILAWQEELVKSRSSDSGLITKLASFLINWWWVVFSDGNRDSSSSAACPSLPCHTVSSHRIRARAYHHHYLACACNAKVGTGLIEPYRWPSALFALHLATVRAPPPGAALLVALSESFRLQEGWLLNRRSPRGRGWSIATCRVQADESDMIVTIV